MSKKRPGGLQRPSSDDPQAIVDKALGKFNRGRLNNALRANDRLVDYIEDVFARGAQYEYWNELPFDKRRKSSGLQVLKHHFSPAQVLAHLPKLRVCGTSFSDGSPNEVCRQPFLCHFCAHSRAGNIREFYLKAARARLAHNKFLTVIQGAMIPRDSVTSEDVCDCILELKRIAKQIRKRITRRYERIKNGTTHGILAEVALFQLDFFVHVSAKLTVRGWRFKPHLHVVIQPMEVGATGQTFLEIIEKCVTGTIFKFRYHQKSRITKSRTASSLSALDYAHMGFYDGVMLKHDMPSGAKLHAIASLTKGFRQISRKKTRNAQKDELVAKAIEQGFANTKPRGKYNARFDFDRNNWVVD